MEIQAVAWRTKNRLVPGQPEGETSTPGQFGTAY